MKYTAGEIQQIIDDLDYAQAFFYETADGKEISQVQQSLKHASNILVQLPDEVIEATDNEVGQVFVR